MIKKMQTFGLFVKTRLKISTITILTRIGKLKNSIRLAVVAGQNLTLRTALQVIPILSKMAISTKFGGHQMTLLVGDSKISQFRMAK